MLYRVASHLENLENLEKSDNLRVIREKSGKMQKSGKVCSCMWSITMSIVLDTKCARKELGFTR